MNGHADHENDLRDSTRQNGYSTINGCNGCASEVEDHGTRNPRKSWNVQASRRCLEVQNPIRKVTDKLSKGGNRDVEQDKSKPLIALGLGDPTAFGHLQPPETAAAAVADAAASGLYFGYAPSSGLLETRRAVAEVYSVQLGRPIPPASIYITSGSSGALQLCFNALSNSDGPAPTPTPTPTPTLTPTPTSTPVPTPTSISTSSPRRSNILLPRPGFPVYECMSLHAGLEPRYYDLLPERNWEVDVPQLDRLADEDTVALLMCNPGNPCGQVFSELHLRELAAAAERLHLPVIADEVYEDIVFPSSPTPFIPFASVSRSLPVLTTSSLSKRYLLPGWRLGWLALHDPANILRKGRVMEAIEKLQQITSSPSCLVQAAVPCILKETPPTYFTSLNNSLQEAADLCVRRCASIPGISCPSAPQGSMFIMVSIHLQQFHNFHDDVEWCGALLREENVALIPGTAFGLQGGWARLVLSVPNDKLLDAWNRIADFCERYVQ